MNSRRGLFLPEYHYIYEGVFFFLSRCFFFPEMVFVYSAWVLFFSCKVSVFPERCCFFPEWFFGALLTLVALLYWGLFRGSRGGHLRLSGGLPGPPRGAILGLPGAFLGLIIF